ncbi:hypothetical protein ACFQZR_05370 [Paenibacillus sp. GCM10027629]|uniref:hypothetical protein n=1 Tax=Paenibacillus sp. GCM10027629 TaxID=3273414 RepID=UPI00363FAB22
MSLIYKGIETVDPIERMKQHELTKSLWQKLNEMSIKTGNKGRITGYIVSNSLEDLLELKKQYQDDFEATIFNDEEDSTQIIQIKTPISRLSLEALIELADILMISAVEFNAKFNGLELDINEVKKLNAPWWKFW